MQKSKNNGSAILTALFIMILVAIAATAMSLRLQIDINRAQLIQSIASLKNVAQQGRLIAMQKLLDNGKKYQAGKIEQIDPLQFGFTNEVDGITSEVTIVDLQGKFNLNDLNTVKNLKTFVLFAQSLLPKMEEKALYMLALNTFDWISASNPKVQNLMTSRYYQSQKPAYQAAHQPMVTITEWRLVKGISQQVFNKLLPYVTTLPKPMPLNLNTASAPVLRTLGAGLTKQQVKTLIEKRGKKGFSSIKKALASPELIKLNLNSKQLTLTSDYFLVITKAQSAENQLMMFSFVKRKINKKAVKVNLYQETLNTL